MGCTVRELLARIDSAELTEWQAYEEVSGPIGDERLDHLFAMLQSTIANVNRSKRQRPYKTEQFEPKWGYATAAGPQAPDEMLSKVKAIHKALGGVDGGNSAGPADKDRGGHEAGRQGPGVRHEAGEVVRGPGRQGHPGQ